MPKQFTVTVGTLFEDSHVPLNKWLQAIYLVGASKKGVSSHQLHRMLGITYRAAWFMMHRLRYAMNVEPMVGMLTATVEADETWVGGRRRGTKPRHRQPGSHKTAAVRTRWLGTRGADGARHHGDVGFVEPPLSTKAMTARVRTQHKYEPRGK